MKTQTPAISRYMFNSYEKPLLIYTPTDQSISSYIAANQSKHSKKDAYTNWFIPVSVSILAVGVVVIVALDRYGVGL